LSSRSGYAEWWWLCHAVAQPWAPQDEEELSQPYDSAFLAILLTFLIYKEESKSSNMASMPCSSRPADPEEAFDPWKIAKARFLEGLDEQERILFNEATIENLYYSTSNLERQDQKDSKSRAIVRDLQPLISAVEDYGKAADTFANIAPTYLAPIWGSIRVILVLASSFGKFYGRMVNMFSRIGDILPRLRTSPHLL
jgi:hypothetical protein